MKRTISLKLLTTPDQDEKLQNLQKTFADACNDLVILAAANKCGNRVKLHNLGYTQIRESHKELGSQMACNAIRKVSAACKALLANNKRLRKTDWPEINFRGNTSIHYDKRTYSLRDNSVSLFTMDGRIIVPLKPGDFQKQYLFVGTPKEAELVHQKKGWFFNLVLELPDVDLKTNPKVLGVDTGESNLAATSTGKLFGGGKLSFERDKYLHLRGRLQRNGSKSARQLLKKVSGRESRHVRHVNHEVSKAIVAEAVENDCTVIALENLTHIREHIKAGRRMRSRLHRWAWRELQSFVKYKAAAVGIKVVYVNPAYTSQKCSRCGSLGNRNKHRFFCPICGRLAHADLNASQNIASLGLSALEPTGDVSHRNVAAFC